MSTQVKLYQCRLCLTKTATRVNIFGGDFPKMLEILTSIKVNENDGLPKFSCTKCAKDVQMALTIKKRIIKAHRILLDALNKKKIIMERTRRLNSEVSIKRVPPVAKTVTPKSVSKPITRIVPKEIPVNPEPTEYAETAESSSKSKSAIPAKIKQEKMDEDHDEPFQESQPIDDEELQKIINEVETQVKKVGFTCEICNLTFPDKSSYNLHSMKHKKTKCHVCGRLIRTDNFKKHLMLHTAGPSVCSLCGATCKNIESLRGHIFYQHKNSAEQYICEECGKSFRIKYKFILHKKKEHLGVRNFKCDICGKGFFTNGDLISHKKMTHEKLRPHVCEYCGTGFSSSYALKTHKRQHTNEKPFVCEFCTEGFRQRVSLKSHLKSKHGIEEAKEWFCKICDKGFATNYALSIHERLHEVQKCEVCSETFGSSDFLINHMSDVHGIRNEEKQKCDVCLEEFDDLDLVTNHMWDIHNVKKETDATT